MVARIPRWFQCTQAGAVVGRDVWTPAKATNDRRSGSVLLRIFAHAQSGRDTFEIARRWQACGLESFPVPPTAQSAPKAQKLSRRRPAGAMVHPRHRGICSPRPELPRPHRRYHGYLSTRSTPRSARHLHRVRIDSGRGNRITSEQKPLLNPLTTHAQSFSFICDPVHFGRPVSEQSSHLDRTGRHRNTARVRLI